jgi:hypothetical protein
MTEVQARDVGATADPAWHCLRAWG